MIYFATCNSQWVHIGLLNLGSDPYLKLRDLKGGSPLPVWFIGFAEGGRSELRRLRDEFSAHLNAPAEGWLPYTSYTEDWLKTNMLRPGEADPFRRQLWAQIDVLLDPGRDDTGHVSSSMYSKVGAYSPKTKAG
jgi:hypothetical protein